NHRRSHLQGRQVLVEVSDSLDAAEVVLQENVFVGCVGVFIGQAEANQDTGNFKGVVHLRDEGNGAAFADEHGLLAETLLQGFLGNLENRRLISRNPGFAGAEDLEFAVYGPGQELANVGLDKLGDLLGILVGNEPSGKLGVGFRGDDGLGAFALIAAPDAVQFKRWANPQALDGGEALLADVCGRAHSALKILHLPRQFGQGFTLSGRNLGDVVVKAGHGDAEILVVEFGEEFRKNGQRIGDGTAIDARVQIAYRAGQRDLIIVEAAETIGNGGHAFAEHGGIGNEESVSLQLFLMILDIIPKADTADFLFAFDQHFDVDREFPVDLVERFQGFQVDVHLAFVVGSAPAKEIAIARLGLEGGRGPILEGLGGLNVIVAIEEDGRFPGRFEGFRVNQGMKIRGHNLDGFEARGTQVIGNPLGGALDIGLVFGFGTDGRNTQKLQKFREMLVAATFDKFSKVHKSPGHKNSLAYMKT